MVMTQPYSSQKIRTSLIGALILSGVFSLNLLFGLWANIPAGELIGMIWALVTIIGSPIGSYRGCLGLGLTKGATFALTVMSLIPPLGFLVQIILLTRQPKI